MLLAGRDVDRSSRRVSRFQLPTDAEPPLDPVLVVPETLPEPELDPVLVPAVPSDAGVVAEPLPVVVAPLVAGVTAGVHEVAVGVLVAEAVEPVLDVDVDVDVDVDAGAEVSVAVWLAVDGAAELAVVVAVEVEPAGTEHAALVDELVPVAVPVPVREVEPDFEELMSAEAPLEGLSPAPPAVGLW